MSDYKIVPGRRAGDGWLVVVQVPGRALNVVRSFETYAEAKAEAERLAALDDASGGAKEDDQDDVPGISKVAARQG